MELVKSVKFLNVNEQDLIYRIPRLPAQITFNGNFNDIYFDDPDGNFSNGKNTLRLRQVANRVEFTFKRFLSSNNSTTRNEYTVVVDDLNGMKAILENLGYHEFAREERFRVAFAAQNAIFELDTIKGIPTFLEIEAATEKILKSYATKLKLDWKNARSWTLRQVLDNYKTK